MAGIDSHAAYSAARGIRWVESHPITEESVGSYLHLTKQHTLRFNRDTMATTGISFGKPTDEALDPAWISRYPTQLDANNEDKTDIFRLNRCPTTKSMVVGGDCEVHYREISHTTSLGNGYIYSPLSVDFGFWQDTKDHLFKTVVLWDSVANGFYTVAPKCQPTRYALQPIARERIVKVNPSSGKSNVIMDLCPRMGIDWISHTIDGALNRVEHQYSLYLHRKAAVAPDDTHPVSFVPDNISIGSAFVFRGTVDIDTDANNGATWGGAVLEGKIGYVVGFSYIDYDPANTSMTGYVIVKVYFPDFNEAILSGVSDTFFGFPSPYNAYIALAEGMRPYQVGSTDASTPFKLRSANDLAIDPMVANGLLRQNAKIAPNDYVYQWTPASEWWEVLNPATYYNRQNETPAGNGKRYILDGANNPATLRIDLTEAYTQAQQTGAGIGSPFPQKRPRGVRLNRIWVNFGLWGNPATNGSDSADYGIDTIPCMMEGTDDPLRNQAITFNLKVEIPQPKRISGTTAPSGLLPFGGRAPTATVSETKHIGAANDALMVAQNPTVKVFTIPLYVNREAGDISPNIQDRFVSSGPHSSLQMDWAGGDYETGFGIGATDDASTWKDTTFGSGPTEMDYLGNSSTVTIWGGMDYYAFVNQAGGAESKNIQCLMSNHPRQSVIGINPYMGSYGFGLAPMKEHFDGVSVAQPRGLNLAALTGITIAHCAAIATPPKLTLGVDPVKGTAPIYNLSPHSFTVALTPIGDTIEGPKVEYNDPNTWIDSDSTVGRYGWQLTTHENNNTTERPFKVGNWLDTVKAKMEGDFSGSMLPEGSRVWLEVTVPQTRRLYPHTADPTHSEGYICTSNGSWVGQVLCSFDVETADGTAFSQDVNKLGDE